MSEAQNIYDDPTFFDGYKSLRSNPNSANNREEKPALFSLAPDLHGKSVLDLGCGYGENCAEYKSLGASRVLGVDISERMLAIAKEEHPDLDFIRGDIGDLSFIMERYDCVFSSLAVHYIEDFGRLTRQVYDILDPGGDFIFSQEHPLTTAPTAGVGWTKNSEGKVLYYNLSDYSISGKRSVNWIVDGVQKYHRTFSEIVNTLTSAGFVIQKMLEPIPSEEDINQDSSREKKLHKPNFLLIKAKKPQIMPDTDF